jgi:hypothetical protein
MHGSLSNVDVEECSRRCTTSNGTCSYQMTGGEVPIDTYARVSFRWTKCSRNSGANDQINSSTWFRTQTIVFSMYSIPTPGIFLQIDISWSTDTDSRIRQQAIAWTWQTPIPRMGLQSCAFLAIRDLEQTRIGSCSQHDLESGKGSFFDSQLMWIQVSPTGFSWIVTRIGTSHVWAVKALFFGFKWTWNIILTLNIQNSQRLWGVINVTKSSARYFAFAIFLPLLQICECIVNHHV